MKVNTILIFALILVLILSKSSLSSELGDKLRSTNNPMFADMLNIMKGQADNPGGPNTKDVIEKMNQMRKFFGGPAKITKKPDASAQATDTFFSNLEKLPLQVLLPKRRTPNLQHLEAPAQQLTPVQKSQHKKKKDKSNNDLLNKYLIETSERGTNELLSWDNPSFKDKETGQNLPFYKIFGQASRDRNPPHIRSQLVQDIIRQNVPFFNSGHITNMVSVGYRKGIMLRINYLNPDPETLEQRTFSITARFKPKLHRLEILYLKENTFDKQKQQPQNIQAKEPQSEISKTDSKPQQTKIDNTKNSIELSNDKKGEDKTQNNQVISQQQRDKILTKAKQIIQEVNDQIVSRDKRKDINYKPLSNKQESVKPKDEDAKKEETKPKGTENKPKDTEAVIVNQVKKQASEKALGKPEQKKLPNQQIKPTTNNLKADQSVSPKTEEIKVKTTKDKDVLPETKNQKPTKQLAKSEVKPEETLKQLPKDSPKSGTGSEQPKKQDFKLTQQKAND